MRRHEKERSLRITAHPILTFPRQKKIRFSFNGRRMTGYTGDTIASALHAAGVRVLSHSPRYDRPRGFFCAIGRCSSCFVNVNGIPNVRACVTYLEQDMKVTTQRGRGSFSHTKSGRRRSSKEKT